MDRIRIVPENTSVIICCAGMGTRLGIGTTKALMDICGEPLILRILKLLDAYDDIRIVVGFQATRLIDVVNNYRKDIMYVFNYDYEKTGVADSLRKALVGCKDFIISLDGDTLVNADDFDAFLKCGYECIPISTGKSAEPVLATLSGDMITGLSKNEGSCQWPGMTKMHKDKFGGSSAHVYEMIEPNFPIRTFTLRTREIDTPEDYERAIEWYENGCLD